MNKEFKQVLAVAGMSLIAGATIGALVFPVENPVVIEKPVVKEVSVPTPFIVEKNITHEVEVEKLVEVEVLDEEVAQMFCDRIMFEDLQDCMEEVKAEDEAMKLALAIVEDSDFRDMLEDKNIVEDEDEVEIVRLYDDFEDVEILKSNFDDEEYKFKFEVKVEDLDEDEKKKVEVTVAVENGEVELLKVEEL